MYMTDRIFLIFNSHVMGRMICLTGRTLPIPGLAQAQILLSQNYLGVPDQCPNNNYCLTAEYCAPV